MSDFLFIPLRPFFIATLAKRWKVQFRKGLRKKVNNVDSKTTYFDENCCIIYIYIYIPISTCCPIIESTYTGYIATTTDPIDLRDDEFYTVFNLSDYSLSYSDLRVISIGQKFTPNPPHDDRLKIKECLSRFDRNLRLRELFAHSDSLVDSDTIKFRKKTTWTPPSNRDISLDMFISVFESEVMNAPEQKNIPSLTSDERQALRNHKRNTEVVIREADKGSAVVVMSRERYIAEAK